MDGLGIFKLFLTLCTVTFKIALKYTYATIITLNTQHNVIKYL